MPSPIDSARLNRSDDEGAAHRAAHKVALRSLIDAWPGGRASSELESLRAAVEEAQERGAEQARGRVIYFAKEGG